MKASSNELTTSLWKANWWPEWFFSSLCQFFFLEAITSSLSKSARTWLFNLMILSFYSSETMQFFMQAFRNSSRLSSTVGNKQLD